MCAEYFYIFLKISGTHSFTVVIGSRGYHVCRGTSWNYIATYQPIKMTEKTNEDSVNIDPYSCKITISRSDKIGPATVGYMWWEILRYVS